MHQAWVASRFRYPLRSLLIKANGSSVLYVLLTAVVVAGGFATSGIDAAAGAGKGSGTAWLVFGIGLVVALAGAISQQFRFGYRSSERRSLAVTLREEGWHFVYRVAPYAQDATAVQVFQFRVDELHRQVAQVSAVESETARKTASAARRPKTTPPQDNDH
jgi:Protein of unknown function (DUF4231)